MNREDIIAMALEAGFYKFDDHGDELLLCDWEELKRFAALVRDAEREACWRTAENYDTGSEAAAAIRARGEA
jgi:hypothetical protein